MKEKQIYILLSDTGTWLSKIIKWYTKEPLNHSSISLDDELTQVYSFGRKFQANPLEGGFVKEDMQGDLFLNNERPTACALYSCNVSAATYERIRMQLVHMEQHHSDYSYNLLGLLTFVFKLKYVPKNSYFCSQFVSSILRENGVVLVDKPSELVTPADIAKSKLLSLIYRGTLNAFLQEKGRKNKQKTAS
jgi:hypothetical protein